MLYDDGTTFHHSPDPIDHHLDINERVAFNSNQVRVMASRGRPQVLHSSQGFLSILAGVF